jgi:hypothetical protein
MNAHRILNITLAIAGAVGIAAVLSSGHLLDDHSADWNHSTALADAQRAAQLAARTEKSAQALCQRIKGPNAAPRWTADGELTCVGTRGQAVSVAKVAP